MEDIRRTILYELDEIEDIENICYTDKMFYKLCSDRFFWKHFYEINEIPFSNSDNTVEEWILAYKKMIKKIKLINTMIRNIRTKPYYFKFSSKDIPFLLLGDELNDAELLDFFKEKEIGMANIRYVNKKFKIIYATMEGGGTLDFYVDHDTLFNYLFNLLSNNIIEKL